MSNTQFQNFEWGHLVKRTIFCPNTLELYKNILCLVLFKIEMFLYNYTISLLLFTILSYFDVDIYVYTEII